MKPVYYLDSLTRSHCHLRMPPPPQEEAGVPEEKKQSHNYINRVQQWHVQPERPGGIRWYGSRPDGSGEELTVRELLVDHVCQWGSCCRSPPADVEARRNLIRVNVVAWPDLQESGWPHWSDKGPWDRTSIIASDITTLLLNTWVSTFLYMSVMLTWICSV